MTDQDLKDVMANMAAAIKESNARMDANYERIKESQRLTDEAMKRTAAEMKASQERTDAAIKESNIRTNAAMKASQERTDAILAKSAASMERMNERYSGISDNLGFATESFFLNSLQANPVIGGVRYDRVMAHVVGGQPGQQAEFDLMLVNGSALAVVEVKHRVHASALVQLERQLLRVKQDFPQYEGFALYGGIAGLSVPQETVEAAHERGWFVLQQQGDAVTVDAQAMRPFVG